MSQDGRKGSGLMGLLVKNPDTFGKQVSTPPPASSQAVSQPMFGGEEPEIISLSPLIPGADEAVSAARPVRRQQQEVTGSPERVGQLISEANMRVPADNATVKLMQQMAALESYVLDPVARKQAALKTLELQGITAADIEKGVRDVQQALDAYFDQLLKDTNTIVRVRDVTNRRTQVDTMRGQVGELERQIADLKTQAQALEAAAVASENKLNAFVVDVEAARAAAFAGYGIS